MSKTRPNSKAVSVLYVRLLGGLRLSCGENQAASAGSRSRKVWLLLAYLLCHRDRPASREELSAVLWPGQETAPSNLKALLHRVRLLLESVDRDNGRGLLLLRDGGYVWGEPLSYRLDVDEFEQLCRQGAESAAEEEALQALLRAAEMYGSGFLPEFAGEMWAAPWAAYYQNLYLQAVQQALELLEQAKDWERVLSLCQQAQGQAPYLEELYAHQMQALNELGRFQETVRLYEEVSRMLYDSFGVQPAEEIQQLNRKAARALNEDRLGMSDLLSQLPETAGEPGGAMFCEYEIFRCIYQALARALARSGDAAHLCLITLAYEPGVQRSRRSTEHSMKNLQQVICTSLRRGDIVSQCSGTQYAVLLNQANYEDSCMVCGRIQRAFARRYPHAQVELHSMVQPVEPTL